MIILAVKHNTEAGDAIMQSNNGIGLELSILSNRIKSCAGRFIGFDSDDLTTVQQWVIAFLYQNRDQDIFQKDYESAFGINRSTASQTIKSMEKRGLIVRESVSYDARLKKILLTQKAIEMHESKLDAIQSFEDYLLSDFSKDQITIFYQCIKSIKSKLDSIVPAE